MGYRKQRLSVRFSCGFVYSEPSSSAPSPEQTKELDSFAENIHHLYCEPGCEGT